MSTKDKKQKSRKDVLDWENYEQGSDELYSYLKKKGKHKRAENKHTDK